MEALLEFKFVIVGVFVTLFGAAGWYFGVSQKKAEENEGVGFVDPELRAGYEKMRLFGRFIVFVGIAIILYNMGRYLLGL